MKCPNCNMNNLPTSSFCFQCGKPLRFGKSNNSEKPEKKTVIGPASTAPSRVKEAKPAAAIKKPQPPPEVAVKKPQPLPAAPEVKSEKPEKKPVPHPKPQKPAGKNNGQIKVRVNIKKRIMPLLAVLFLFLCALVVWQVLWVNKPETRDESVFIPAEDPSIGILYFSNNTGDNNLDIWKKGISHGLIIDLQQSRYVKILSADRLNRMWDRLNLHKNKNIKKRDLLRMASFAGINHVIRGDFSLDGSTFRINAELLDTGRGEVILSAEANGDGESGILDQIDEIAEKIRSFFPGPENLADGPDHRLSAITTESVEAFKHFVRGRQLFFVNNIRSSLAALDQAVRVDPSFSLAVFARASAYSSLEYWDRARKQSQAVQGQIAGISERYRYRLQGDFYRRSEKTFDIAFSIYRRLLELYPGDRTAMTNLGWLYYNLRDWENAEQHFKSNQDFKIHSWENTRGLFLTYLAQEKYSKADKVISSYVNSASPAEDTVIYQAALKVLQGELKAAKEKVEKFDSSASGFKLVRLRGELAQLEDQHLAAETAFAELLEHEETIAQLWGYYRLAQLYAREGRFTESHDHLRKGVDLAERSGELGWKYRFLLSLAVRYLQDGQPELALQETEKAWEIAVQGETADFPRQALLYRGLALLFLNRLDDARKTAAELEVLCKKGPAENRMRYFYRLEGEVLLAENNYSQAIDSLTQAVELLPSEGMPWSLNNDHAAFYYPLAIAYYLMGGTVEALSTLDIISDLTWGRLDYGEITSLSLYMKGKIYEETGIKELAADFFEAFINSWQNADPDIPELAAARERLALLSR